MKRPTRFYSTKQEKAIAKELNGKQVANSGATRFLKGDVVVGDLWLIEAKTKTTESKSFSIKKDWLEKNKEEAFAMNKRYNTLCFDFGDNERYYVLDEKTFKLFNELLKESEDK